MAVFPCPDFTPCLDPGNPVANLTAEASDGPEFIGLEFPFVPDTPVGNPTNFTAAGCLSTCTSTISQQDADLCAQRQAFICAHGGGGGPGSPPPPPFFFSSVQVCNLLCPDGSIFSYRTLAGAFVALSQAAADEQAAAFACEAGRAALICLSSLPGGCLGNPYASTIEAGGPGISTLVFSTSGTLPPGLNFSQTGINTALVSGTITGLGNFSFSISVGQTGIGQTFNFTTTGSLPANLSFTQSDPNTGMISGNIPSLGDFAFSISVNSIIAPTRSFTFGVTAGSLPPGLSISQSGANTAVISGTPLTAGNFAFTVRATESNGNFMERVYTVDILGITNSPPSGTKGTAYSFSYTAAGGTAPYTFFLASGALPDGLSMDSAGNITGTPTTVETSSFTVQVTDSSP